MLNQKNEQIMLKLLLIILVNLISIAIIYFAFFKQKEYVRVSASGKAEVKPDKAHVSIGLSSVGVTQDVLEETRNQFATTFEKIINNIKVRTPDAKIETQNFRLSEDYQLPTDSDKPAQPKKFTLKNSVTVTLENNIDLISSVIDSAIADGANDIGDVSYSLTEKETEKAMQKAQAMSMKNAFEKANNLAQSGGRKLCAIETIEETGTSEIYPLFARSTASSAKVATPILAPETVPLTSNVTVQYSFQ